MADLPTCWYCPECGRTRWPLLPCDWHPEAPVIHKAGNENASVHNCEGVPVEASIIPPGTPLPVILDALGHHHREGWFWSAVGYVHIGSSGARGRQPRNRGGA